MGSSYSKMTLIPDTLASRSHSGVKTRTDRIHSYFLGQMKKKKNLKEDFQYRQKFLNIYCVKFVLLEMWG